jgi:hypothetical protein
MKADRKIAYYVIVVYSEYSPGKFLGGYRRKSKIYNEVWAKTSVEAAEACLSNHKQDICPSVSCIWPLYPQPTSAKQTPKGIKRERT